MRYLLIALTTLMLVLGAMAQPATPAPTTPTNPSGGPLFSVSTQAVALRIGGQTVAATDLIGSFYLTNHIVLQSDNLLAPANNLQGYYGGIRYNFSLNSLVGKTNIPKDTFQPYLHGAFGVVRNVPATGTSTQSYSGMAGGGFDYDPTGGGHFAIGPRVEYFNAPGFGGSPHGVVISANLTFILGSK